MGEGNVLTRVCPSTNLSVHGGGESGQRSIQLGGGQVQPAGGGSGPAGRGGGGQVKGQSSQGGGGQVQSAGGGEVSILCPLAGGMPLAFTQEDFLVVNIP